MSRTVSKDGATFYEIPDTDDDLAGAQAKGYKEYFSMTKNGDDVFHVPATEENYKGAIAKGYQDVAAYNFTEGAAKRQGPGKAESAFRGTINGLTQTFGDEVGGAMEAAGASVGVRGLGSPDLSDIRLETDAEDKQPLADTYRNMRDRRRQLNARAEEANPGLYTAGDVGGSVVTGVLAPGTNTLKGATALGAAQGLGRSKADLTKPSVENYGQAAIDTIGGAAAGAAGYGLGKGIEAGVTKGAGAAKSGWQLAKGLTRGAARGAKEAGEDMPSLAKPFVEVVGGLKGAVQEMRELNSTAKEFTGIAAEARDLLQKQMAQAASSTGAARIRPLQELTVVGNGKSLADFTDDEAVLGALLAKGDSPNPVQKWFATKSATLHPGQVDADDYSKLLGLGTDARNAARDFDHREAAAGLKGNIQNVQDLFEQARSDVFGRHQEAAKATFDHAGASSVLDELDSGIADANRLNSIPAKTSGVLADVHGMLNNGTGIRSQGLTPGAWNDAAPAEKFTRLQKARELLDSEIKWTGKESHKQAEGILRGVRGSIDDALKTSPEKVEGDALWRASKDVEGKFFGPTEFRDAAGNIDVDEGKLARLLGNTDNAARWKASIPELKAFAAREDLSPAFREKANAVIADLESKMSVADTKRAIGAFRYTNGPSSPAIERLGSVSGGSTLLRDAVRAPAGFLNQADQYSKFLEGRLGKPFGALDDQERAGALRLWTWIKRNPDAGTQSVDHAFARFIGTPTK